MRRRLFTFLSAISLLLCIVAIGEWAWNRGSYHGPRAGYPSGYVFLTYRPLGLWVAMLTYQRPWTPSDQHYVERPRRWHVAWEATPASPREQPTWAFRAGAFGAGRSDGGVSAGRVRYVLLPHWFLVLATAFLPAAWIRRRWRRSRRKAEGLCPTCGYDLRATPDRCPECGAVSVAR